MRVCSIVAVMLFTPDVSELYYLVVIIRVLLFVLSVACQSCLFDCVFVCCLLGCWLLLLLCLSGFLLL